MFRLKFKHVMLAAFFIRLLLAPLFSDDFNLWANMTFVTFLMNGYNPWTVVYNDPCLHWINPWRSPPLQLSILVPATIINNLYGNYILTLYTVKLPLILADIIALFFLYNLLRALQESEEKAVFYSLFFAFNPVVILASTVGAPSTDSLPTLFTLMSLYYFLKSDRNNSVNLGFSAVFMGLAAASKLYPVFLIPALLVKLKSNKSRITYLSLTILPFVILSLPFILWDYTSYINMLFFHNVGGEFPALAFLSPNLNLFLKGLLAISSIAMLIISYILGAHVITNMVLAFLSIYSLMGYGFFDVRYFTWFSPFAILLISCEKTRIRGGKFLPFLFLPSFVIFSIYNGPCDVVEGRTGFFYLSYHWIREKVAVFKVLPHSAIIRVLMGFMSIFLILYYFLSIAIKASSFSFPAVKNLGKPNVYFRKNVKLLTVSIIFATVFSLVSISLVPYENRPLGVYIRDSTLRFYDDFSCSTLSYQWSSTGNGNYSIRNFDVPSHIVISGNITLYRGWGPIWQGFQQSSNTTLSVRLKFEGFPQNSNLVSLISSNGGQFMAMRANKSEAFVYLDEISNKSYVIADMDENWHIFQVKYLENIRLIYFDGEEFLKIADGGFTYLLLGRPFNSKIGCGKISIDYVEVIMEDFNMGQHNTVYTVLSLLAPLIAVFLLLYWIKFNFIK